MMRGSNRLSEIKYYDANATRFSDDGFIVPGSCDGFRLLNPRPGCNQLWNVIDVLKSEAGSRRATVVIYHPEDAGRSSKDVPCTIALSFNLRSDGLYATTIMRAKNAFSVLPYDYFLFSLVSECVASALNVCLAQYYHFAVSMHIYERDYVAAGESMSWRSPSDRCVMGAMPSDSSWEYVRQLCEFEERVREGHQLLTLDTVGEYTRSVQRDIQPYWADFANVLLLGGIRKSCMSAFDKGQCISQIQSG